MQKTLHGKIHGKTIELTEDPGLNEGQEVEVIVKSTSPPLKPGEGWQRMAGLLADEWTEEDDRILEILYRERAFGR